MAEPWYMPKAAPKKDNLAAALSAASALSRQLSGWKTGTLAPVERNIVTGDLRPAIPMVVQDAIRGMAAPGNALRGQYDQLQVGPDGSVSQFDPRMMDDAAALAGAVSVGSVAVPAEAGALRMGASAMQRQGNPDNFGNWFGASKAVDQSGAPLTVYHGTGSDIAAFDISGPRIRGGKLGKGIYVTPSAEKANLFAKIRGEKDSAASPNVMPLYVRLETPFVIVGEKNIPTNGINREVLKEKGFDGVMLYDENGTLKEAVAFDPNQVKSKYNSGAFDNNDPNVLNSVPGGMPVSGSEDSRPGSVARISM